MYMHTLLIRGISTESQAHSQLQQGRTQEKGPAPHQGLVGTTPALAKQSDSQYKPSVLPAPAEGAVSGASSSQHAQGPSSSAAPSQEKAVSADSSYVSAGAIPFDVQPAQPQIPFEDSSSAAMLQRPSAKIDPMSRLERAEQQRGREITMASKSSDERPVCSGQNNDGRRGADAEAEGASIHGPEDEPEHDDGPMEEILLHTDTESVSNEVQEEEPQQSSAFMEAPYPAEPQAEPSVPADSNGSFSMQQSTQAASAAVAEAIAAANRAAQEAAGTGCIQLSDNAVCGPSHPFASISANQKRSMPMPGFPDIAGILI